MVGSQVSRIPYRPHAKRFLGAVRLGLVPVVGLAALMPLALPTDAHAQFFGYGWNENSAPRKQKKKKVVSRKSTPAEKAKAPVVAEKQPSGPLVITIALKSQRLRVFDADGQIAESPISSGRVGNPTPLGVFTILEKNKVHYSNLYAGASMPNMQRITWSGVAMHAGVLPGYPASHGCIRLPHSVSARLFGMTKLGHRVIVARDPLTPQPFSHPLLFKALPPEEEAGASAAVHHTVGMQVADASGTSVPDTTRGPDTARVPATTGSTMIGISTAAAAEVAPPAPVTNSYREKWKAELARLAAAIPEAEAVKAKAAEAIPSAAEAAENARAALKAAKSEADKAASARKKAAGALESADRDLMQFVKRMTSKKLTEADALKLAETEDKLEGRITELTGALEAAKSEAERTAGLLKNAEAAAIAAETARKSALNELAEANAALKAAIDADAAAKRREAKRKMPVSVFVSLKTKKLYVRQGYEPILEVPVTIQDPEKPIGTHVFTALALEENKTDVKWSVVSVPTLSVQKAEATSKKKKSKDAKAEPAPLPPVDLEAQKAERALERITIPDEVREQIADVMKPGSSLLISDNGLSNETGKYTDFIVSLR